MQHNNRIEEILEIIKKGHETKELTVILNDLYYYFQAFYIQTCLRFF